MTNHPSPSCVVKVGDRRGFIIEQRISTPAFILKMKGLGKFQPFVKRRLVVTAAHCLPHLPPAHAASYVHERTYPNLVGQLHGARNVSAEYLFVDPIADIAVLGSPELGDPNDQDAREQAEAYDALTKGAPPLRIGKAKSGKGWLLALDRDRWVRTPAKNGAILACVGRSQ